MTIQIVYTDPDGRETFLNYLEKVTNAIANPFKPTDTNDPIEAFGMAGWRTLSMLTYIDHPGMGGGSGTANALSHAAVAYAQKVKNQAVILVGILAIPNSHSLFSMASKGDNSGEQGFVKGMGTAKEIFSNLIKGITPLGNGMYKTLDNDLVGMHPSTSPNGNGEPTIDINQNGQLYKIRIIE